MPHNNRKAQPLQDESVKGSPHLRLTPIEVMARKDYMRCDQYLADLLASMKAIGWKFVIHDIPAFAAKIGLQMRTFQRARRMLIAAGKLVEKKLNRDSCEFFLVRDDDQAIAQDDQAIAQDDQAIAITPFKPAPQADLNSPSDLLSDPYTDPLSLPTPKAERETSKLFENEKPIAAYKDWLAEQGKKMPRPIGNMSVWIHSVAKRIEWQESFLEWQKRSIEIVSVAELSPSTAYFNQFQKTPEEIASSKAAMAKARLALKSLPNFALKS